MTIYSFDKRDIEICQMYEQRYFYILNSWQTKKNTMIENPDVAKENYN